MAKQDKKEREGERERAGNWRICKQLNYLMLVHHFHLCSLLRHHYTCRLECTETQSRTQNYHDTAIFLLQMHTNTAQCNEDPTTYELSRSHRCNKHN